VNVANEERDLAIAEMEAKVKKNEEGREAEVYIFSFIALEPRAE
jgi:hypothetical protein